MFLSTSPGLVWDEEWARDVEQIKIVSRSRWGIVQEDSDSFRPVWHIHPTWYVYPVSYEVRDKHTIQMQCDQSAPDVQALNFWVI